MEDNNFEEKNNSDNKTNQFENLEQNNSLIHSGYDLNNLLNNKLNTKIYREVSTLITKNEKYPYFLLQLFRLCNEIKNEKQWQKLLILLENVVDENADKSIVNESNRALFNINNNNNYNNNNNNNKNEQPVIDPNKKNLKLSNNYKVLSNEDNIDDNCNNDYKISNANKNKNFMISEKIYDQFYNELDEALKDNNNKMKNSSKNSKIIVKNIITTANEKEIKNIYNNDDGMYIKDLSTINLSEKEDFENKKESMMQLERELKKLLQLQKEQIEYKKKIEKQLEEQKKNIGNERIL
jgi:hypothetical protein